MAQVNLGRIGFVNKGSWNSVTNYKLNDVVKYGGSTYAAKRPNVGITPPTNGTDTDDWFYFINNSDYMDKASNQDITGIKNFTNGITTSKIDGDKTIDGETTFTVSPTVPKPTDNNDAVNKAYVDDKTIINNFTNKPTPENTDNLALQETGGLLKKLSFANLKNWILSLFNPSLTGTVSFNSTTNNISLTNIVTSLGLEIGDVIQISGATDSKNNSEFTIEVITDNNNVIVNQAHANKGTTKNVANRSSDTGVTVKLLAKWYNAPLGLGQGWVNVQGSRVTGTNYVSLVNRSMQISARGAVSDVGGGTINGVSTPGAGNVISSGSAFYANAEIIPPNSIYSFIRTPILIIELR